MKDLLSSSIEHLMSQLSGSDRLLLRYVLADVEAGAERPEPVLEALVPSEQVKLLMANSNLDDRISKLETDTALHRSRISDLEQENVQLEADNAALVAANKRLDRELNLATAQNEQLRAVCQQLEAKVNEPKPYAPEAKVVDPKSEPVTPAVKTWTFRLSRRQVIEIVGQLGQKTNYEAIVQDFGVSKESVISVAQTWGRAVGQMRAQANILTRDEIFEAFKRKIMTEYAEAA